MATTPSLDAFLKAHGIPDIAVKALMDPPYGLTSVPQFANFFDTKAEVKSLFADKVDAIKENMALIADLKQCWREAEALVERQLKRTSAGLMEEAMDEPLRTEVQTGLTDLFQKKYGHTVPPSWMGTASLTGRLHREFVKRVHTMCRVRKIKNMEMVASLGPQARRTRVGDMEISLPSHSDQGPEISVNTCATYIFGLRILTYTMAVAGSFMVDRQDGEARIFAPLGPLLEHLAKADSYVMKYTTGGSPCSDAATLRTLTRIDEAVRGEWARMLRNAEEESYTLGDAMDATKSMQVSLWITAPQAEHHAQSRQPRQERQAPPPSERAPLKRQRGESAAPAPQQGKDNKAKTCRTNKTGKALCKMWNDARGCTNPKCEKAHECDIMLPSEQACGGRHRRHEHRGPTVPL